MINQLIVGDATNDVKSILALEEDYEGVLLGAKILNMVGAGVIGGLALAITLWLYLSTVVLSFNTFING